jgi:uncharacterized FAD-dependent dehydrogenase
LALLATKLLEKKLPKYWMSKATLVPIVIIGAGPAGLFAAYELVKDQKQKILILEKGNNLASRSAKETLCGVGGSGTFSDGKLHFSLTLSHEKLLDFCSHPQAQKLIDYVENLFLSFGVTAPVTPTDQREVEHLVKECRLSIFTRHAMSTRVGTKWLPNFGWQIEIDYLYQKVEVG